MFTKRRKNQKLKQNFLFEEAHVLIGGQKCCFIRYLDLLSYIFYHYYKNTAGNPLYQNLLELIDGTSHQYGRYGETMKRFTHEIYQWPMNNHLSACNQSRHISLLPTSNLIRVKLLKNSPEKWRNYLSRSIRRFGRKKRNKKF